MTQYKVKHSNGKLSHRTYTKSEMGIMQVERKKVNGIIIKLKKEKSV